MRRLLLLALAVPALAACDRPVVDLGGPRVEVVRPASLDVAQPGPSLDLALRADVFGTIDSVTVNRQRLAFDAGLGVYQADIPLAPGLNVLTVDVYAAERTGSDTLYAFRAALAPVTIPVSGSPAPVAGAAVSTLDAGDALLSGGAGSTGAARSTGTRISLVGGVLSYERVELAAARAQHSSTLLPDGRVLLVGGVSTDAAGSRRLAGTAEVVDPATNASTPVPVVDRVTGAPVTIGRAGHVARGLTVDGIFVLYVYGGRDDRDAPSNTFDVFRWDDGTLVRLSPPLGTGGGGFPAFSAPVIVSVPPRGVFEASSAVFGLSPDDEAPTALRFDWLAATSPTYPFDLEARRATPLADPRSGAAALAVDGFALVSGGTLANGTVAGTFEAYVPSADRAFRFGDAVRLRTPRTDHSATLLPDGRILIVGGRDASGTALFSPEAFQL